ncbi:hypothetical protein EJB05_24471, partial [Eragrostis curvula]
MYTAACLLNSPAIWSRSVDWICSAEEIGELVKSTNMATSPHRVRLCVHVSAHERWQGGWTWTELAPEWLSEG